MKTLEQSHADLVEFMSTVVRHSERLHGPSKDGRSSEAFEQLRRAKRLLAEAPKLQETA